MFRRKPVVSEPIFFPVDMYFRANVTRPALHLCTSEPWLRHLWGCSTWSSRFLLPVSFFFWVATSACVRHVDSLNRVQKTQKKRKNRWIVEIWILKTNNKKEMKAITSWFFKGGGSGGDIRVEGEYRGLTSLSL